MEMLLHQVIEWIQKHHNRQRLIIAISGHGAAGKTTFAKQLLKELHSGHINYLNTDPYIIDSQVRKNAILEYTYQHEQHRYKMTACHPGVHHLPSLERDVQMVKNGLDLYTIDTHYSTNTLISSANQITIVEGMSAAFINPQLFDLKVYFYTDDDTELARRFDRDLTERSTSKNYLLASHNERRIQYKVFMHPYSEHFDIIVQTTRNGIYVEKTLF